MWQFPSLVAEQVQPTECVVTWIGPPLPSIRPGQHEFIGAWSSGRLAVTASHLSVRNWGIFAGGISQAYIGVGGFATLAMRIREFASILTFRRTPQISARRFYGVGLRFLFAPELLGCSSGCSRNCPILVVCYVFCRCPDH